MKKKCLLIPLLCFVIVLLLFRYVIYIGYVPSESMEPTIPAGSRIVGVRIFHELHAGDIIVFEYQGRNMVKRIAAESGDKLTNELIVPDDCYYVLGDNTHDSYDSRYWDNPFMHKSQIIAIVFSH